MLVFLVVLVVVVVVVLLSGLMRHVAVAACMRMMLVVVLACCCLLSCPDLCYLECSCLALCVSRIVACCHVAQYKAAPNQDARTSDALYCSNDFPKPRHE